jgi:hypothetical protein
MSCFFMVIFLEGDSWGAAWDGSHMPLSIYDGSFGFKSSHPVILGEQLWCT